MVNFSTKFVDSNPGHWELYADGIRVCTFSIEEIAGVYANNKDVVKFIYSSLGKIIETTANITQNLNNMLPVLRKIVQTYIELTKKK